MYQYKTTLYNLEDLEGLCFEKVEQTVCGSGDKIIFWISEDTGERYEMYHEQDCCENVRLEDICGDLKDLEKATIASAKCKVKGDDECEYRNWTFYDFRTLKGDVTLRWKGESEYYSTSVNVFHVEED